MARNNNTNTRDLDSTTTVLSRSEEETQKPIMPARIYDDLPIDTPDSPTAKVHTRDDVVISGISCRLPESDSIAEFKEHLMNGDDMVTEDDRRWPPGLYGLPKRNGKLKDLSKFDASFFGVHPKQAHAMDPQLRMMLEVTHEALVDAGMNPVDVRGSRTGVFIGCSASEAWEAWSTDPEQTVGYEMTGCTRSMFANRLSFSFDFKGPSFSIDTACSSSLLALDKALKAIREGECDAAIVGGSSLCLNPITSLQFQKLGMLSPDGACQSFDDSGNGYCRSEGIVCIYLQKQSTAKRVYATLVHSGTNSDGNKKEGITFPSGEVQQRLLKCVYSEAGVNPASVAYVEAHGTGTKAGDPQEVNTIADVFCKGRDGPLLIGSTKSNMGHPEPASGLAALAKVVVSMEEGSIPANLHFKSPNPDIPGLLDGRLKVVAENTKWNGGYVGINSFGFGGSNVHVLLHSNNIRRPDAHPATADTRLFTFASRTEEGLRHVLSHVRENADNVPMQALLQESSHVSASTHPYRGYTLLNTEQGTAETHKCPAEKRPLWYVFAGMGTQWHGMGRDLMCLESFHKSIMRSDAVLRPYDLHLYDIIMHGDENVFENTLHSFVGIAAVQVALVDVLKDLGLEPDGIVGHSVGELGCAYADGGLTGEETVLAAYWRGRCVREANLPPGGMAAVGLTWNECKSRCPAGVVPACHNSIDTVTISGPKEQVTQFVAELKEEGIFAKVVNSAGVAFHSYFMQETAPALRAALKKVIKENRLRTSRWISSSIPESRWHEALAQHSSADYHVNNLLSPVLFQEALKHVPDNAVVVEIAPHCLLQAILKRSLPSTCSFVGLMKRNHPQNLEFLLTSLGKLYMAGVDFSPLDLHPNVRFPVPLGTPMISPLVQWDHTESWAVPKLEEMLKSGGSQSSCSFKIDTSPDSQDHYLLGHMIDGRVLFPATGYLVLAWRALAKIEGYVFEEMPVVFEDIHIHQATILPKNSVVTFDVSIMPGSGDFSVSEAGQMVVSGRIYLPSEHVSNLPAYERHPSSLSMDSKLIPLTSSDIYKELRLRGYDYGPTFQGILSASNHGNDGYLLWNNNWVSFLDTMLQIQILTHPGRGMRLPTRIASLRINPKNHPDSVTQIDSERQAVKVIVDNVLDTCVAGGAELLGLHATVAPRRQQQQNAPTLEEFHFVPYVEENLAVSDNGLNTYVNTTVAYVEKALKSLIENGLTEQLQNIDIFKSAIAEMAAKELTEQDFECYEAATHCVLFRMLREIFSLDHDEKFLENAKSVVESHREELHQDKLLRNLLEDSSLKPSVDLVLENGQISKVKVIEVGACEGRLYPKILSHYSTQPMLQVDYTAVDADIEKLNSSELEALDVKTAAWIMKDAPPSNLNAADLVVIGNSLHMQHDLHATLTHLSSMMKDSGFLLVHEPTMNLTLPLCCKGFISDMTSYSGRTLGPFCDISLWTKIFAESNLEIVSKKSDGLLSTLFLLRKKRETIAEPLVINVDSLSFNWVEQLKDVMNEYQDKPAGHNIWLVSDSFSKSGIVGMVNCLRQEPGGDRIRCMFSTGQDQKLPSLSLADDEFRQLAYKDLVMNVRKNGHWGSFRHLPYQLMSSASRVKTKHAYVNVLTRGDLSSLRWIESPLKHFDSTENPTKELCDVYFTSLNFRDVMLATGKLPPDAIPGDMANQDCILGMEFSGRDSDGKRVMGLLPAKGLATTVDVNKQFLWDVPEGWSLQEAASVPVVYATVYYALVVRGRIRKGDKVLIHSGSGGVGQAAIAVALHHGCEVFTTVGSQEKKDYLKQRFPQLTDRHFANSRDTTFAWSVLNQTGGRGVDVVLNSLAEEKLQASLRVLAPHGRFLEIGKFDLSNNTPLGMSIFLKNISFHGILLDALFEPGNADWEIVSELLKQGIAAGAVRPLKTTVFDKDDIEGAFRFMAQGKHIGKVVVQVREEENTSKMQAAAVSIDALPRSICHPHKSYIITGGLGGFGMELSHWLIDHGATKLVLTGRSGVKTGYQSRCIRMWRETGIKVMVSTRNVKTQEDTEALIKEAQGLGPVGGVFHLAMVLRDGMMDNQTAEQFQQVADPKVAGTINLDVVTRQKCCNSLDWFVVFSSVSCGRGNAGQANYGFANSVMERVCEERHRDHLPSLAIQWGAIGDVGVVLDTMGGNDMVIGGTLPQRILSCLATLDQFLNQPHPVVSSFVCAEKKAKSKDQSGKADLVASVANILGVKDVSSVNPEMTLADLGLDSLMGVEVKQTLERDYDINLAMREIRLLTINKLRDVAGGAAGTTEVTDSTMNDSGVSMRYSINEIMPTQCIVEMVPADASKTPLFLVHPIEGSVMCLESVVSNLEGSVYGIQCTAEAPLTSIPDLAAYYIQEVRKVHGAGPFHLAGYSFGACVALEMAMQLEGASDPVSSLVLLDGSHQYVAAHTASYKAKMTPGDKAQGEAEALCAFILQFVVLEYSKLVEELLSLPDWESRVQCAVQHLMKSVHFPDTTSLEAALTSFYKKLVAADAYTPTLTYSSAVTLIKASTGHDQTDTLGEKYGLEKVCTHGVEVHVVEGDHESFIQGESAKKVAGVLKQNLLTS